MIVVKHINVLNVAKPKSAKKQKNKQKKQNPNPTFTHVLFFPQLNVVTFRSQ